MWYLVLSRRLRSDQEAEEQTPPHRDWLDTQHRAGRLLFSGPTTDGSHGIYIVLAESLDEAKRVAGEDPFHVHNIREMQVLEWRAHRAFRLDGPTIDDLDRMAREPS